ncbi:MAG TPA: CmcJ/NvfI family oxidoreductase, partial [Polyangiaceae bacterium]
MTTSQQVQPEAAAFVEAELNYLRPQATKPVNYAITPPAGVPQRGGQADPRRVRIFDARTAQSAPTLDRNGFEVRAHRSQLSDFSDEDAIVRVYYPEAEALLKELTGA